MTPWSGSSSSCGSDRVIGGYNNISPGGSLTRTYTLVAAHNSLEVTFTLFAIDNWETHDQINIQVGSAIIPYSGLDSSTFPSNICGGSTNDLETTVKFTVAHSGSTISLTVTSALSAPASDRSFGIRDITIRLYSTAEPTSTAACSDSGYEDVSVSCCPVGQFLSGATCTNCDTGCTRCTGTLASLCTACEDGYYFDGTQC